MVFAILAACNGNKQAPEPAVPEASRRVEGPSLELSAVDSLLWRQPDSALAVLQDYLACRDAMIASPETPDGDFIETHAMRLYDRHYANLLLAELLYKNDYAQTNRMELLQAVGYFDSLTFTLNDHSSPHRLKAGGDPLSPTRNDQLFFLSARAHYINGVGYYEHDSVVPACQEYLKALEVMEEHFEEEVLIGKKTKFMALTYTRLVKLFSDLYLHEQAIYFGKRSLKYYQKYNAEPWHIAWMLNMIGLRYDILDNYDSSYFYCSQGLKILPDTNSLTYRDIKTHLAYLSYKVGEPPIKSLHQLYVLISKANDVKEYYSRCLILGEIFYHEAQFDSAWNYFNKVYEGTQSVESKKLSAERLVEICKAKGNEYKAMEYAEFLVPFANMEENQSAIKSQLTELYKKYGQLRLERVHQQEKMRSLSRTMIIVGSLLVLMLFITILYHKNKKKKQHLETQIAAERHSHQIQQDALSGRLKQKSQEVRELQDQLKQQNDRDAAVEPTISFDEEPICRLIMERVKEGQFKSQMDCNIYKDFALSKEQLMALHGAANRHFDHFTERLAQTYPDLTKSDLDYCCLYLFGLTDADVAALMQRAYSTVSDRSRKLKTVFGSTSPLSITLHRIANQETTI